MHNLSRKQGMFAVALLACALSAQSASATCVPVNVAPKDVGSLVGDACIPVTVGSIIPSPHVEACSVTIGSQIWVVSGSTNSSSNTGRYQPPTTRTDIFSPVTNTWSEGPRVNVARDVYPNVFNVNGTLFLVGGMSEQPEDSGNFDFCDQVEVCRPDGAGYTGLGLAVAAGDTGWHLLPSSYNMPTEVHSLYSRSTAVVGTTLYLFTPGRTVSFDTVSGVWNPDLATQAGANTYFSCAIALHDQIYVSGGDGGSSPTDPEASLFGRYDPASNSWTNLARFPDPGLAEHTMEIVGDHDLVVVGGDFKGNGLYYYDPTTNVLASREAEVPLGQPTNFFSRSDHVSGIYNGTVYLLGGIVAGTTNVQPAALAIGLPL